MVIINVCFSCMREMPPDRRRRRNRYLIVMWFSPKETGWEADPNFASEIRTIVEVPSLLAFDDPNGRAMRQVMERSVVPVNSWFYT